MIQQFAKVDANLDAHPKIVDAGFWGSVVFQFVLRINWARGCDGHVPSRYVTPAYIARVTGLDRNAADLKSAPEELIGHGIERAIDAGLIRRVDSNDEGEGVLIELVGWDDQWKGAKSATERKRAQRAKERDKSRKVTPRHGKSRKVTDVTTIDKKRSDKNRSDQRESEIARARDDLPRLAAQARSLAAPGSLSPNTRTTAPPPDASTRGDTARRIWAEYRAELQRLSAAMPGLRVPPQTVGAERPVLDLLRAEVTAESIEHAVECYVAEAELTGEPRWLNPTTLFAAKQINRVATVTRDAYLAGVGKRQGGGQRGHGAASVIASLAEELEQKGL